MLKVGSRNTVIHISFYSALDDPGFAFPPGHQDDFPGTHDGFDPHGDRIFWDILFSKKFTCSIKNGHKIKGDQPGGRIDARPGLIEADMTGSANAKDLQVYPSGFPDFVFIFLAEFRNF